jgi:hypothetical protein
VQDVILAPVECLLVGIDCIAFVERFFLGIAARTQFSVATAGRQRVRIVNTTMPCFGTV